MVLTGRNEIHLFIISLIKRLISFILSIIVGYVIIRSSKYLLKKISLKSSKLKTLKLIGKFLDFLVFEQKYYAMNNVESLLKHREFDMSEDRPVINISKFRRTFKLFYYFVSLQISYLLWGLLQERIMSQRYILKYSFRSFPSNVSLESYYYDSEFLVLSNRFVSVLIAAFYMIYVKFSNRNKILNKSYTLPPFYMHSYSSISNTWSSWFQYESLKFISFPLQVLVKSMKMVPVILMNSFLWKKKQSTKQYLIALIICIGSTIFIYNSDLHGKTSNGKEENSTVLVGVLILIGYLVTDSFTGTWQSELFSRYKSLGPIDAMLSTGIFTLIVCLFNIIIGPNVSVRIKKSFDFIMERESFGWHLLLMSSMSAIGQIFIFKTINDFGAIVFTGIMVSRQLFSIILSNYFYNHPTNFHAYLGIFIAFGGLTYDIYFKFENNTPK